MISVIIPVYNHERFLHETINSILAQSYQDFEIIAVDDGSTDNSAAIVSGYPQVRLIRQENKGISAARNQGMMHSRGDYLVFLDGDDRLLPEALELGVRELELRPKCGYVSGRCQLISENGEFIGVPEQRVVDKDHYYNLILQNYIWTSSVVMFRRSSVIQAGGYNLKLTRGEDYDLYLRIARVQPVCCYSHVICEYRQHSENSSAASGLMLKYCMIVLRSQWKYVKHDRRYRYAYKSNMSDGRKDYGGQVIDNIVKNLRTHAHSSQAFNDLWLLLNYYPEGIILMLKKGFLMWFNRN